MEIRTIKLEIAVNDEEPSMCSRHCPYNDSFMHCNLFDDDIDETTHERVQKCINADTATTPGRCKKV